jgi:hypothetical protein
MPERMEGVFLLKLFTQLLRSIANDIRDSVGQNDGEYNP